uniref:Outer dense fiber protein 3-like protein 1 n=1 Tax=Lygus hesperus TaxID=30085 RepID=A0A0A9WQ20_LYGHE
MEEEIQRSSSGILLRALSVVESSGIVAGQPELVKAEEEVGQPKVSAQQEVKGPKLPYCIATAGPGPASYKLPGCVGIKDHDPSKWRGPAYSIQGRGSLARRTDGDGPGPKYDVRKCTRFGVITAPSVKFQKGGGANEAKKVEPPRKVLGFQEEKRQLLPHEMKGFTIAGRHYTTAKGFTPAPNQYKIPDTMGYVVPDLKRAPAFSLQSRPYMRQIHRAPGPAEYTAVDSNLYKAQAPRAIMSNKRAAKIVSDIPGPTAYLVNFNLQLPRAATFAFGLKHSICAGTMRTPVDNSLNGNH